ncbi:MAG: hypothetical protein J1F67_07830 [Muribaculaceae bacterium]|nr:hypothetical protein [Muribaculaceae bacterium]
MKKLIRFSAMALLTWGLASCSNDFSKEPSGNDPAGNSLFSPVKTPKVNAWSGTQSLNNGVYGTRAEETDAPAPITQAEIEKVKNIMKCYEYRYERINGNDKYYYPSEASSYGVHNLTEIDEISDWRILDGWTDYFVQEVANSNLWTDAEAVILSDVFKNDEKIQNLAIWKSTVDRFEISENEYQNSPNKITIPDSEQLQGSYFTVRKYPIVDMSFNSYPSRAFTEMGNDYTGGGYFTYKVLILDGKNDEVYVAIYHMRGGYNFNNGSDRGSNDWFGNNYWNRIIKLTKTAPLPEVTEPEIPETPTNNSPLLARLAPFFPVCDVDDCGHPVHEGPCPECEENGKDIDCTTKDSPNVKDKNQQSEVEVNLSILDEHDKYDITDLVTKLSIHVRYPRDVEVILPVPANIYCDQDDLYILKDHYDTNGEPNWAYDGEYHNVVYNINGQNVELHVEFVAPDNDDIITKKTGFIRVYTKGINEEVIAYLYKNFGDGINFEIFNYYNRGTKYTTGKYPEIKADELQGYLNHSMINFDWEELMKDRIYPAYYIMAFNELDKDAATGDGDINEKDCYVWIFGDDRADHDNFYNDNIEYEYSRDLTTNWFSTEDSDFRDENERSFFHNAYKGTHYNSSKYNWIFTHKGVTGSADPEEPTYTPMPGSFPFE